MKINSITMNTGYLKKRTQVCNAPERKCELERNNKDNYNDKINTTIRNYSDGRASFKGSTPFLHNAAKFASASPLVAEALFALVITCGLRPLTIMATARTEEDKEKCSYQAAKSISSGLVGLALTAVVGTAVSIAAKNAQAKGSFKMPEEMKKQSLEVVKKGIDSLSELGKKLTTEGKEQELTQQINQLIDNNSINLNVFKKAGKNALKLFEEKISQIAPNEKDSIIAAVKQQTVINNYEKTAKNVIDKFFQPIFMPIRANITIALVPTILGLLGLNKNNKKSNKTQNKNSNPYDSLNRIVLKTNGEKELFQTFGRVACHENK